MMRLPDGTPSPESAIFSDTISLLRRDLALLRASYKYFFLPPSMSEYRGTPANELSKEFEFKLKLYERRYFSSSAMEFFLVP